MKIRSLFGRKQWMLAALVVLLGGAVYLNYWYAGTQDDLTQTTGELSAESSEEADGDQKVYGEAQLVNGDAEDASTYFTQAALEREKSRDESVETVKAVLAEVDVSSEAAAQATAKIVELTEQSDKEDQIENLIRAKGFENCLVYLSEDNASVVVETDGLTAEQAAQIKSIILSEQEVAADCISITEISANSIPMDESVSS